MLKTRVGTWLQQGQGYGVVTAGAVEATDNGVKPRSDILLRTAAITGRAALTALLAAIGLGGSLLATLAVVVLGKTAGASDAWLVALAVPQFLIAVMQSGITAALLPMIAGEPESVQAARTRRLAVTLSAGALTLALVLSATAPGWIALTAPGLTAPVRSLATEMARQQVLALPFAALVMVLSARGQSAGAALQVEAAGAIASLLFVASLSVVVPRFSLAEAGWLVPARWAVQALLLAHHARRIDGAVGAPLDARQVARKFAGFAGFAALYQATTVIDRFLLSFATDGAIATYAIVSGVVLAASSVLERGLVTPALPLLFGDAKRGDLVQLRARQIRLQHLACRAGLAAALALAALAFPLLRQLVQSVPSLATNLFTSYYAALLLAPCLAVVPAGAVAAATLNARGEARVLLAVIAAAWIVSLAAKAAGAMLAGMAGVAAGTTLYFVAGFLLLDRQAARR